MRQWKKVFLDLGLEFILCRENGYHHGFSIFYIFKHSDGRQDACFCRILHSEGRQDAFAYFFAVEATDSESVRYDCRYLELVSLYRNQKKEKKLAGL